ncbi:MAG: hypothetical protein KK926_02825 [Methanomethylovorans sp.]|nr:hypothetical protein [Methanomethylovorans sp.]
MNGENRDFIIERLERQLREKEAEIDEIKRTLRDSILVELRSEFKNDLDINNRLLKVENRIQELANNLNGVMDELLDQKSLIRSFKKSAFERREQDIPIPVQPSLPVPPKETTVIKEPEARILRDEKKRVVPQPEVPRPPHSPAKPPSFSIRPTDLPRGPIGQTASVNQRFNIRDAQPQPSPVKKQEIEQRKTEYIIAESDDARGSRKKERNTPPASSCEFIVAKDNVSRKRSETDYESVEARDDEDAVVTVTRRK